MAKIHKKRKRPTRPATINLRDIPRDVRDQFKAYCARRGYSMISALLVYMRKCIQEERKFIL